jgi:hypothetical protein
MIRTLRLHSWLMECPTDDDDLAAAEGGSVAQFWCTRFWEVSFCLVWHCFNFLFFM